MIKGIRYAYITLAILASAAGSATPNSEQKAVMKFMQRMYSYSANMFEFGQFEGRYVPDKQCALMNDFYLKELFFRPEKSQGCKFVQHVDIRYPGAGSEDLSENAGPGQMPKPKLSEPKIDGDKASVSAVSEFGKTIFFLIKTEKGWRVENALYYERIPTELNVCHGQFLKEATPAQIKSIPACKDY